MSACPPRGAPRVKRARGRLCPTGSEPLLAQGGWRGPWCAAGSLAALGDSRMVAGSRGLEGLTSGELLLGPGAGRSRALAQKRGRLLTARPPGPGCLGTGARRPRVPCGQRAVGVRQWWRLGGRRGASGPGWRVDSFSFWVAPAANAGPRTTRPGLSARVVLPNAEWRRKPERPEPQLSWDTGGASRSPDLPDLPATQRSLSAGKRWAAEGWPVGVPVPLSSCPTWRSLKRGDVLPYQAAARRVCHQ